MNEFNNNKKNIEVMLYAEKSMQPSTTKSIRKRGRLIGGNFSKEVEFEQKAKKKKKKMLCWT